MASEHIYDVIIIGSGPGQTVSFRLTKTGLSVALVENERECHFWACIPSKALFRPPEVVTEASEVGGDTPVICLNVLGRYVNSLNVAI